MTQNREAKFVVQYERDYDEKEETLALIASLAISQCEKQVGKGVSAEEFRKTSADYSRNNVHDSSTSTKRPA